MVTLEELKTLYGQYAVTALQVRAKAGAFAGMLGFGNDPRNHSCHDAFFEAVERWTAEFAASQPTPEAALEAVRYILEAAKLNQGEEVYWYYYAVQGTTRCLIPFLAQEDCRRLRDWYDETYPAVDRPPVQREVFKLLQQYSGQQVTSCNFLQRLFKKK